MGLVRRTLFRIGGYAVKIKDYIKLRKIVESRRATGKAKSQPTKKRKKGGR